MKGLRVSLGKWKGKELPIPPEIQGHQNFTNSLVKKAIFSLIESKLMLHDLSYSDILFFDFFSGSGQIAAEAYSLDAKYVYLYELNQDRFSALLKLFRGIPNIQLFRKDATKHFLKWEKKEELGYVFYLDPPYTYWSETPLRMKEMLESLHRFAVDSKLPFLILSQIPEHQKLDLIWREIPFKLREYGSHSIVEVSNDPSDSHVLELEKNA